MAYFPGTSGNDQLFGTADNDEMIGGSGNDSLNGEGGGDVLYGGAGHDTLNGGDGNDSLDGGTGNDVISGGDGFDAITGGAGHDSLDGQGSSDFLIGGTGNDTLRGGDGDDYLYAGVGDTFLTTNWGADVIDGGNGHDTAVLFRGLATAAIRFDLRDPFVVQVLDDGTRVVNVEQVTLFTGRGDDSLGGGDFSDTFIAGAGNDTIHGLGGDDFLHGLTGHDYIHGGVGRDYLDGGEGDDSLYGEIDDLLIDGGEGHDTGYLGLFPGGNVAFSIAANLAGTVTIGALEIRNLEQICLATGGGHDTLVGGVYDDVFDGGDGFNVIDGAGGNDVLFGGGDNDRLFGGTGRDTLYGTGGDDTLTGESGEDLLNGGAGDDLIDGGDGNDSLYGDVDDLLIDGGEGHDTGFLGLFPAGNIAFSVAANLAGTVTIGNLEIRDLEQVCLAAGGGHDTLVGGGYDDTLDGGDGFNVIDGAGGNDILFGGGDNDRIFGGTGRDTLYGAGGDDTLTGDSGEDLLNGGAGDDRIDGGSGIDTVVYSGNKADYEVYRSDDGIVLRDLRQNGDGTDTLVLVDRLAFADGTVTMSHMLARGRAPVAKGDTVTLSEDGIAKVNVLSNDRDGDGDVLSLVSVTSADPNLSFALTRTGQVTVTPGAAYQALGAGQSVVKAADVVIRDPYGNTSHSTLSITITGVNDAPTAVNDAYSISEDKVLSRIDVTHNDRDADANAHLFVSGLNVGSTFGTVTINDDGTLSYDPGRAFQYLMAGETATDSFMYQLSDGAGGYSMASVTVNIVGADEPVVTIGGQNDPFVAHPAYTAGWDMVVYG